MSELPFAALPAAPLSVAVEESAFQRLLNKPLHTETGFEALAKHSQKVEEDLHADFLRLLERDYNPRGAAPTKIIERFKGLKGSRLDLAGLIASLSIIYITELAKANRELGRNPEWVNWFLDATDFVPKLLAEQEREKAERETCDCCDKIAAIAIEEIRRVKKTVQENAIKTDDRAKRYLRRQVSRAN